MCFVFCLDYLHGMKWKGWFQEKTFFFSQATFMPMCPSNRQGTAWSLFSLSGNCHVLGLTTQPSPGPAHQPEADLHTCDTVETSAALDVLGPSLECGPHTFGVDYFMLNWWHDFWCQAFWKPPPPNLLQSFFFFKSLECFLTKIRIEAKLSLMNSSVTCLAGSWFLPLISGVYHIVSFLNPSIFAQFIQELNSCLTLGRG